MTRLLPIKKNLKESLLDNMNDPDKLFTIWSNQMSWHHFLGTRPKIWIWPDVYPHKVIIYCKDYFDIIFDWLTMKLESNFHDIIFYSGLFDNTEEIDFEESTPLGVPHHLVPGQRYLENFVHLKGE